MADACVQTHSSQAGDNLDMDELEVQTASATLNLTDDNMCQEEADSDYDSDCDIDDVMNITVNFYRIFFHLNFTPK